MSEHVAKFCVIRLSLLAARAADEASSHFSCWTGSDLSYQMLPPALPRLMFLKWITSQKHREAYYVYLCTSEAGQTLLKRCWDPSVSQWTWGAPGAQAGEWSVEIDAKCFLQSDETNYVLIAFFDRCTHIPVEYLDWLGGGWCWNGLLDLKHGS